MFYFLTFWLNHIFDDVSLDEMIRLNSTQSYNSNLKWFATWSISLTYYNSYIINFIIFGNMFYFLNLNIIVKLVSSCKTQFFDCSRLGQRLGQHAITFLRIPFKFDLKNNSDEGFINRSGLIRTILEWRHRRTVTIILIIHSMKL